MCLDLLTVHFRFIGGTASEESSLHTKNMEHTALHTEQPFPHHCIAISTLHTCHVHGTMIIHITMRHYIALHCTHTAQSHCTAVHNYRTLTEALHTNCAMHSERPCTLAGDSILCNAFLPSPDEKTSAFKLQQIALVE